MKNSRKSTKPYPNKRRIVDVCLGIFDKNNNTPLHVGDIYNRMKQRHWGTHSELPCQTVASRLFLDYRFVKVAPNTFQVNKDFYKVRSSYSKKA